MQWRFDRVLKQCTFCPRAPCASLPRAFTLTKDPMAMDIDALTAEQKQQYMKDHRCFKYRCIGHRANNCQSGRIQEGKTADKKAVVAQLGEMTEEDRAEVLSGVL